MFRTTPTQSVENLSLLLYVAKDAEVGVCSSDCKNKTDKKLHHSKNLNGAMGYLTPNAKQAFTQLRQVFTKAPILQYFDPKRHI